MKKFFALFLTLVVSAGTLKAEVYNGTCGKNLTWELNSETGILNIQGSGHMEGYYQCPTPWEDYAALINQVVLPEGLLNIGSLAFTDCKNLTTMNFPNSIEYIGEAPFPNSLTTVLYNKHIFAYLPRTFSGEYVIPDGIESIEMDAFRGCEKLTAITIPNSLYLIYGWAFDGCTALKSVTNYFPAPQKISSGCFSDVDLSQCTLYVLKESVPFFKVADGWGEFGEIIGIDLPQGIEHATIRQDASKVIHNGHIYILRNNKTYTLQGQELK